MEELPPARLHAFQTMSRELCALLEADGRIVWADARATQHGIFAGNELRALAVTGCESKVDELCRRAVEGPVHGWELALLRSGSPITMRCSTVPSDGRILLLASVVPQDYADVAAANQHVVRDIEELNRELARKKATLEESNRSIRALHAELLAADQRKDEFLAMLAHELRNPLAALQLGLPILERFPARDTVEERAREAIARQMLLLNRMVGDLLDVSRVTRGRIELQLVDLDLGALVLAVCESMTMRVIEPRAQTLRATLAPGAATMISGDSGRLEQVITNLIDNASKYSDLGAAIEIEVATDGGWVTVAVKDAGVGIDPLVLPRIFDLFTQATTSLARSRGGLGIGLTLVKTLVEMHGGTIAATSAGLGKGTELTVSLPALTSASVVPPAAESAGIVTTMRRILLIDDNEDGREMLRFACEQDGHQVSEAADGLAGVARASERSHDVAFIDIGLPGIDGYEVARRIRTDLGPLCPRLIALSGYGSAADRERASRAGFDQHVTKPLALDQLRRLLAHTPLLEARGRA